MANSHSWSLMCTSRYNRVQHFHEQTALVTVIFKTLGLIRLTRILSYTNQKRKQQIPKLSRVQTAWQYNSHESGWPCLSGWLALPRWLISIFTKRLLYRDWNQRAWALCYPLSCLLLCSFAGPPGRRDYLENLHPGSRHHNTEIPAKRAGSVVI